MRKEKDILNFEEGSERGQWHNNTARLLGCEWIKKAFELISKEVNIPQEFTLRSPSANYGTYEQALFNDLINKGKYVPHFILSDLSGEAFRGRFNQQMNCTYLSGNIDAKKLEGSGDIILDIKGAIWYAVYGSNQDLLKILKAKENLLELFTGYCSYLKNDNSILIFDITPTKNLFTLRANKYRINKGKKLNKVSFFAENSTYKYLKPILKRTKCEQLIKKINCEITSNETPLARYMGVGYIEKKDLDRMNREIEKMSRWRVGWIIYKRWIILYAIIVAVITFDIVQIYSVLILLIKL